MILSFCLGLCIGKMTEMGGRLVQVRDKKDVHDMDVGMNLNAATAVKRDHLGTGTEVDIDCEVNQWKFWETEKPETVFLMTKTGTSVHLKPRCPGMNGADPEFPLKEITLCGHCRKWKIAQERRKYDSRKKIS